MPVGVAPNSVSPRPRSNENHAHGPPCETWELLPNDAVAGGCKMKFKPWQKAPRQLEHHSRHLSENKNLRNLLVRHLG